MSSENKKISSSPLTSILSSPPTLLSPPRSTVGLSVDAFTSAEATVSLTWVSDVSSSGEPNMDCLDLPTHVNSNPHPKEVEVPARTSEYASAPHQTDTGCLAASSADSIPPLAKSNFDPRIYNQKYLLQKYAGTFCLPKIVDILNIPIEDLILTLESTVCAQGKPLLIQNFHKLRQFDKSLFSLKWLKANKEAVQVAVNNLEFLEEESTSVLQLLNESQDNSQDFKYYGKDVICPSEWHEHVKELLPSYLHYLGPNDLNRLLSDDIKVENLMIHVGHGGTHTASHFDNCGTIGHNLMVQADEGCSAIWFIVGQEHADKARKYWYKNGKRGTSMDQGNSTLSAEILGLADFPIYVFEQKLGDLVMIPSEGAQQVVNLGPGVNTKYFYNRSTAQTLDHCLNNILPVNRRILKTENYCIKTMIEQGVLSLGQCLKSNDLELSKAYTEDKFLQDFSTLLKLYAQIIAMDAVDSSYTIKTIQQPTLANDFVPHTRTCEFCHCNIWNTWFHCNTCGPDGEHDFCSDCVAENRQCLDYQNFEWLCHRPLQLCFQDLQHLTKVYNSSDLFSHLPSFSCVPEYSNISDLETIHPETFSPMTCAIKNNDSYKLTLYKTSHCCSVGRLMNDMVECTKCKSKYFCHKCLSVSYGINPSEAFLNKAWECYFCKNQCICSICKHQSRDNVVTVTPYHLTDYNNNYKLETNLSYFPPECADEYLIPNFVEHPVFIGVNIALAISTDNGIPKLPYRYAGTLVGESIIKRGHKRSFTNPIQEFMKIKLNFKKKPFKAKKIDAKPKRKQILGLIKPHKGILKPQKHLLQAVATKKNFDLSGSLSSLNQNLSITSPQSTVACTFKGSLNPSYPLNSGANSTDVSSEVAPQKISTGKRKSTPESSPDELSWISPIKKQK